MLKQIIPTLALAVLTGCGAIDSHVESERLSAQARTSEVVRQSQAQTMLALLALSVGIVTSSTLAVLVIIARMERQTRQETTCHIARPATPPMLDDPEEWPETRARRRALTAARQEVQR